MEKTDTLCKFLSQVFNSIIHYQVTENYFIFIDFYHSGTTKLCSCVVMATET